MASAKNRLRALAASCASLAKGTDTYRKVTGKRPKAWRIPRALFRRLVPEFADQIGWHNRVNFSFGSEDLRQVKPDASGLADFLGKHPGAPM